jgi:transposase
LQVGLTATPCIASTIEASIEVSRRLRHVKTDRLDGDRLLAKLIRHHAGERGGWSVVRVPGVEEEDASG